MPVPLLHSLPLVVIAVVAVLSYFLAKDRARPAQYRLGEPWTAGTVLWSAVDEIGHGGSHGEAHGDVVGKAVSGEW
ncbi:MAG: aa3-type cytochrome oxidase subunit CtaJ [Segniliparus sp.]|uniref:aa3-type cytochrome oxidase subunit CtaJ n=1 Tax=Segniliparus sp. TaxID=2804064 RepID=UPI003F3AC98B